VNAVLNNQQRTRPPYDATLEDSLYSVCVYCSASAVVPQQYLSLAAEVGTGIARRSWQLVSGGENVAMMGAIARAARNAGARTVGVVPRALIGRADIDAEELLVTETTPERKALMEARADAILVLPGGIGTCEELFATWTARAVALHAKPFVLLDPDGHYIGLLNWIRDIHARGFVTAHALAAIIRTSTVEEAVEACAPRLTPSA
jgi:uncharacterized protein (TIGR00730 family)